MNNIPCGAARGTTGPARPAGGLPVVARAALLASCALGLSVRPLRADDAVSPTDERVRITLGVMHVSSDTTLQGDSRSGLPGTVFNGEQSFGLDKTDVEPKFQAMVRIDTRNRLSFDYFTLDRRGDTIAQQPIAFRDVLFIPGDPLQTTMSLRTLGITYGYSFWHSETLELAATVGVHATDLSTMARVNTQTRHIFQTDDEAGPVPTAGLDATWVASRRFYLDGRAQYLTVHVNNFAGSLGIYEGDALYRFRPNVSFGVGYTGVDAKISSNTGSKAGRLDFTTQGPEIFLRVAF
jgi:hypothetical protein